MMERQVTFAEDNPAASSSSTTPRLPDLNCSKYSIIGNPKARKGRGNSNNSKGWTVPNLPKLQTTGGQRTNVIDTRTIYSQQQQQLYKVLSQQKDIPSPLQCSPRVANFTPDARDLQEKSLVMRDFFSTGPVKKYERDRAVIPSVYAEFFDCPSRRKSYVRQMYSDDFRRRNSRQPPCDKKRYGNKPEDHCHFCDVVGNKYCSFCMEFKNRNFALSYEQNYLPMISLQLPDFHSSSHVDIRAHKPKTRV